MFSFTKLLTKKNKKHDIPDVHTQVDIIVEQSELVVTCETCGGDLLKKYATTRKTLRYENGKPVIYEVSYCQECNSKLEKDYVVKVDN